MILGISGFWFFWPKNGRFVTHTFSPEKCWNPYFIVFWGRVFWAKVSKKEILDTRPKQEHFGSQLKNSFLSISWFLLFFWGGRFFVGQVRWPEGPPHLALNPLFVFFCSFLNGHLTWPKTLLICFSRGFLLFFVSLTFLCFNRKALLFALKRSFFVYFWVSPFVSP